MQDLGRVLLGLGLLLAAAGALVLIAGRFGIPLGRLPGDITLRGKHFSFYAPMATCLLISLVLSLIVWLLGQLRR